MNGISIIIPVKPGGQVSALEALRFMSHELLLEVLVVEGTSPSRQRNRAVAHAKGDIVYFLDDDSQISSSALARCAEHFSDPAVAVVGGPSLTPPGNSRLQQLFGAALTSLFGAGPVRNRYRAVGGVRITDDKELILCNLAFRKSTFLEMGGFDERLYPNEENELLARMKTAGLLLVHDPQMSVLRSQRSSLGAFVRQMFSYGRGRAQQTRVSGQLSLISLAPVFFVIYLILIAFLFRQPYGLMPLTAYLALDLVFSLRAAREQKKWYVLWLLLLFPLMHVTNGLGLMSGLVGARRHDASGAEVLVRSMVLDSGDQPLSRRT